MVWVLVMDEEFGDTELVNPSPSTLAKKKGWKGETNQSMFGKKVKFRGEPKQPKPLRLPEALLGFGRRECVFFNCVVQKTTRQAFRRSRHM